MQHTSIPFWTVWFIYLHVLCHNPPLHWALSSQCDRTVYSSCRVLTDWLKSLCLKTVCWLAKCLTAMETLISAFNSSASGRNNSIYPLIMQFSTDCQFAHAKAHKGPQRSKMTFQRNPALISPSLHHQNSSNSEWQDGWDGMCNSVWMAVTHCSGKESWEYAMSTTVHIQWKIRKWSYWRLCRAALLWQWSRACFTNKRWVEGGAM